MAAEDEHTIRIEDLTPDEVMALPRSELDALVFTGAPIVFRSGSARVLGEFRRDASTLVVELAHIDGGGEGVLPTLRALAHRYAEREGLATIDWIVHAVSCAEPNPKLQRVLERRGFVVETLPDHGRAYRLIERIADRPPAD